MLTRTNVKINLGLGVLRKREDGFHDIETLFVPHHGLGDTIEIISADDWSRTSSKLQAKYNGDQLAQGITQDGKLMVTVARREGVDWNPLKDLCAKAYFVLARDFDLPSVKIFIEKEAPVGAGLGGGSADGAAALKMLDELCGLGLSTGQLETYAASLGSDCPFFILNRPAIGRGRGEVLEPFDLDLGEFDLQVVVPEGLGVSTAEAYSQLIPREVSGCELPSLREALARPVEEWKELLVNDFEASVFAEHPELAAMKQSLYDSGATYASMSGSGSALFALYRK